MDRQRRLPRPIPFPLGRRRTVAPTSEVGPPTIASLTTAAAGSGVVRHFETTAVRRTAAVSGVLAVSARPVARALSHVAHLPVPLGLLDSGGLLMPPVAGTRITPVDLGTCRAELITPAVLDEVHPGAILYTHGGGFRACGLRSHRRLVSRIAARTGRPVLSVDYRMLPRTAVSTAVDDCVAGLEWLLDRGHPIDSISVMGDSAGAFLAIKTAVRAHETGLGRMAAIVCLSPFLELDATRRVQVADMDDPMFGPEILRAIGDLVTSVDARRPGVRGRSRSPLDDDLPLHHLPPVLIQGGTRDRLLADARALHEKLSREAVPHEWQVWHGQPHVFQLMADFVTEGARAVDEIATFVRTAAGAAVLQEGVG